MKILIIGAGGMLGRALISEFTNGVDNKVDALDRDEVDISQEKDLRFKIETIRPELLINSAAYTDVDGAESKTESANSINGRGVGNIARTCRELDIPFVHFSTEYVFDGKKRNGYREDDLPNPISAYGRSKFLGETELQKNMDKFYLVRLSRLFGKESPLPLMGSPLPRKRSFVNLMLDLAKTREEIEVVDEEISLPTFAPDLARQVRYIVENKPPFGIYHSPNSGRAVTWFGFAAEIFKIAGINVNIVPVSAARFPRPASRPRFGILLNTKLPRMRPWPEALAEFLKSQKFKI